MRGGLAAAVKEEEYRENLAIGALAARTRCGARIHCSVQRLGCVTMARYSLLGGAAFGVGVLSIGMPSESMATSLSCSLTIPGSSPIPGYQPTEWYPGATLAHDQSNTVTRVVHGTNILDFTSCAQGVSNSAAYTTLCTSNSCTIDMASFNQAAIDAQNFWYSSGHTLTSYVLQLPPGTLTIACLTPTVCSANQNYMMYLDSTSPAYAVDTNPNGWFVIEGSSSSTTTLGVGTLDSSIVNAQSTKTTLSVSPTIGIFEAAPAGVPFNHVNLRFFASDRQSITTTVSTNNGSISANLNGNPTGFGTLVAAVSSSVTETVNNTAQAPTSYIQLYLPTEDSAANNGTTSALGFSTPWVNLFTGGSGNENGGQFLRVYYNGNSSGPILAPDVHNFQVNYHGICQNISGSVTFASYTSAGTSATVNNCPANQSISPHFPDAAVYTFLLGSDPGNSLSTKETLALTNLYQYSTFGTLNDIVCFKNEGGGANFVKFNSEADVGSNAILDTLNLRGQARGQFNDIANIQVSNVSIEREPAFTFTNHGTQQPCLSTGSGGLQFHAAKGSGSAGATYGNTVTALSATATGDDTILFDGDTGGANVGGTTLPISSVIDSTIMDSFVRAVQVQTGSSNFAPSSPSILQYAGHLSNGSFCGGAPYERSLANVSPPDGAVPGADIVNYLSNEQGSTTACTSTTNTFYRIFVECPENGYSSNNTLYYCPVMIH